MSSVLPSRKHKGKASTGWIWRMVLGMGLIELSLWGIALCQRIFRTFVGPNVSPADTSFATLASGAAWFVFFGPIAAPGLAMLWFALRKLGPLDRLAALREDGAAEVRELRAGGKPPSSRVFRTEETSYDGLESLSDEEVARLKKRAYRAAILLGLFAGTFFVIIGVFGLIVASFRVTVTFAISSGVSILAGLTVLQRTLRKENNAWLFPLKLFTHLVFRRHFLSLDDRKSRPSERVR
jgi:hypothetical protein